MHIVTNAKRIKNKIEKPRTPETGLQIIIAKTEVDHQDSNPITPTIMTNYDTIFQMRAIDKTLLFTEITLLILPITIPQTDTGQVVMIFEKDKIKGFHIDLREIFIGTGLIASNDIEAIQINGTTIRTDKVTDSKLTLTQKITVAIEVEERIS